MVWNEIIVRAFRGDSALKRVAVQPDLGLWGNSGFIDHTEPAAFHNANLRLDDIQARYLLGNRVLDLNARIDLDEIDGIRIHIHQELNRACPDVIGDISQFQRGFAQCGSDRLVEIGGRGPFDDLLIAPLDRTIPFEQM